MNLEWALEHLAPLKPEEVARWRRALETADQATHRLLERHIMATARRLLGAPDGRLLLPPPPRGQVTGELELGTVLYHKPWASFGLKKTELLQGLAIYGRSGAGKTNVVFGLINELSRHRIPFLFLDWKRTARHLLPILPSRVCFYTPGRDLAAFPFNPFVAPPGVDARVHAGQVIDILAAAYTLGDGAKSLLQKAISEAAPATLPGITTWLESHDASGRSHAWKTTALRALHSLSFVASAAAAQKSPLEFVRQLLGSSTVIELDALDDNAKRFLIPSLMLWLYSFRLAAHDREQLRLVIIIEEAHHLLLRGERRAREPFIEQVLRQCRELGLGVVVVDQHPHLLSGAALGNTYASICLNLKDPADLAKAAALSALEEKEKQQLSRLPVGYGIVKLQDRWRSPFLVQFPHISVAKGAVTDAGLAHYQAERVTRSVGSTAEDPSPATFGHLRFSEGLSEDAARLLADCSEHPTDGVRARYQRLGLSMDRGGKAKEQLLRLGLARAGTVAFGQTRRLILVPTPEATEKLLSPSPGGHESIAHAFWKHAYAERSRSAGYAVTLDAPRAGGRVDVLARNDTELVGIEVETGRSDFVKNVKNCLRSRFDRVFVVPTSEAAREKVEQGLGRAGLLVRGRVEVIRTVKIHSSATP